MAKKSEKWQAKQEAMAARRAAKAQRRKERRKAQAVLSRAEIAEQLRALATQVESGAFALDDKELALPAHADFEIAYKPLKRGGHEIEVEIQWGRTKSASLLPAE